MKNISSGKWMTFTFNINSADSEFDMYIDGNLYSGGHVFSDEGIVERIIFRTGDYRLNEKIREYKSGDKYLPGFDETAPDEPVNEAVFYIRNFSTKHFSP